MSISEMSSPREYFLLFFDKILHTIEERYLGEIDYDLLFKQAVEGVFSSLDEYSGLLSNNESAKDNVGGDEDISFSLEEIGEKKLGLVCLKRIHPASAGALKEILQHFKEEHIEFLLLDLRGNSGGALDSLLEMCNYLVRSKKLFYSKDQQGSIKEYFANGEAIHFLKRAVLIDEQTRSAAELLALVLREDGALIAGQKSFGKGVSQQILFVGKLGFKLTTHEYFSYKTGSFHGCGIFPDYPFESLSSLYLYWKNYSGIQSGCEVL